MYDIAAYKIIDADFVEVNEMEEEVMEERKGFLRRTADFWTKCADKHDEKLAAKAEKKAENKGNGKKVLVIGGIVLAAAAAVVGGYCLMQAGAGAADLSGLVVDQNDTDDLANEGDNVVAENV